MAVALRDPQPVAEAPQGYGAAQSVAIPTSRQASAFLDSSKKLLERLEADERQALQDFEAARGRARAARTAAEAMRKVLAFVSVEGAGEPKPATPGRASLGQWSRQHDACIHCGTTERRHASAGLCQTCESYRRRNGTDRPLTTSEATP